MMLHRFFLVVASLVAALPTVATADTTFDGRVTLDGKSVPNAIIIATLTLGAQGRNDGILRENPWNTRRVVSTTDANGTFSILSAEPTISAYVVAAAPGLTSGELDCEGKERAKDRTIELHPLAPTSDLHKRMGGRVTDASGHPISGAIVVRFATFMGRGASWGGERAETISISGPDGTFAQMVASPSTIHPVHGVAWKITAPNLAPLITGTINTEQVAPNFVMNVGATISGRVQSPAGNADPVHVIVDVLSAVQGPTVAHTIIAVADATGAYSIPNVPAGTRLRLYAVARGTRVTATTQPRDFGPLDAGKTTQAEPLQLVSGVTIAGRIVVEETGGPLPPGRFVLLLQPDTRIAWREPIADDGTFTIANVPTGAKYALQLFDDKLMMAPSNPNYVTGSYGQIEGMITRARSDLVVRLCIRRDPFTDRDGQENLPLRGVEATQ